MEKFKQTLKQKTPEKIAGMKIQKVVSIDGYKFIIDNDTWIGFRLSGTEPIVRLYAESSTKDKLKKLVSAGIKFINGK
jgi:phosphomannomutase